MDRRKRWAGFGAFAWFVVLSLLAPATPAEAQGSDKAGDKLEAKEDLPFAILGKNFNFGRDVTLFGEIAFESIGGTIPSEVCTVKATESNSVTLLGQKHFLRSMDLQLKNTRVAGATTPSGSFLVKMCDETNPLDLAITGGITFKNLPLERTCEIKIVPVFTVDAGAWVDGLPEKYKAIKGVLKTILAGQTFDVTLDVKVNVTQKLDIKNFSIAFPADGIDATGTIKFTSTTTVEREVTLVKFGLAILKFDLKVVGNAKFDLSDTTHEIDAHPRFDTLKGKSTVSIGGMDATFGGSVQGALTISLPLAGDTEIVGGSLLDFPKGSVKADPKSKVVYTR